jgi:hypothetical protein
MSHECWATNTGTSQTTRLFLKKIQLTFNFTAYCTSMIELAYLLLLLPCFFREDLQTAASQLPKDEVVGE